MVRLVGGGTLRGPSFASFLRPYATKVGENDCLGEDSIGLPLRQQVNLVAKITLCRQIPSSVASRGSTVPGFSTIN